CRASRPVVVSARGHPSYYLGCRGLHDLADDHVSLTPFGRIVMSVSPTRPEASDQANDPRRDTASQTSPSSGSRETSLGCLAEATDRPPSPDKVDIASMDSCPCSDPPGY